MANALFNKFKQSLLSASPSVDLDSDVIKVALINTAAYTFSPTHQFLSSVSAGIVGTPQTLTSVTVTDGVFDAADTIFPSVTGSVVSAILFFKDTGIPATSPLIAYFDTGISNFPFTPNGGGLTIVWDDGANKIFRIG